jgi:hypothetical protein
MSAVLILMLFALQIRSNNQVLLQEVHAALSMIQTKRSPEVTSFAVQNGASVLALLALFEQIRAANNAFKVDLQHAIEH